VLVEGGLEVRPLMVKVLARFSEEDHRSFEASYNRVSQWAKRHDKSTIVNYTAPDSGQLEEELDLVAGWRMSRNDNLLRKIPSFLANRLIAGITNVHLHDYGCTLKVYRAHVIKGVRLYGDMHRFIPAWIASTTSRSRIKEEVVNHHARKFGKSKYGLSRAYRVLLDLLSVYFFMRFRSRPGHFFGRIGLLFGTLGALALGYLFIIKVFFGEDIGTRPLLLIGVLCVLMSVQFLTTGVLSELVARTYFESSDNKAYIARNPKSIEDVSDTDWKYPK